MNADQTIRQGWVREEMQEAIDAYIKETSKHPAAASSRPASSWTAAHNEAIRPAGLLLDRGSAYMATSSGHVQFLAVGSAFRCYAAKADLTSFGPYARANR